MTRTHGGVGGRGREASSYPDWARAVHLNNAHGSLCNWLKYQKSVSKFFSVIQKAIRSLYAAFMKDWLLLDATRGWTKLSCFPDKNGDVKYLKPFEHLM